MKKVLIIVLALTMVFAFAACGGEDDDMSADLPNPMTEYDSLEEINEKYGVNLVSPGIMGVSDSAYFGIDTENYGIAEFDFVAGGYKYCFRASSGTFDDISGIYNDGNTIFYTESQGEPEEMMFAALDNLKAARWFVGEKQYVLSVEDNGEMDEDVFRDIAEEMQGMTDDTEPADLSGFTGSYTDSVTQRAVLDVSDNGDNTLHLLVSWGSSASETDQWEMDAVYTADGALYYTNGVHRRIVFPDDAASEEVAILSEDQTGSFTAFDDGRLAWMGAADDDCKELVFEKDAQ